MREELPVCQLDLEVDLRLGTRAGPTSNTERDVVVDDALGVDHRRHLDVIETVVVDHVLVHVVGHEP